MRATKIIVAYVHDRPGVLTKIASIFYRRGMNILTMTVGRTTADEVSKIVFRVSGESQELHRLVLSVDNLIDVISVNIHPDTAATARELCLVRLALTQPSTAEQAADVALRADARVLQTDAESMVLQIVDAPERIDAFLASLSKFHIVDLSRTGPTAMPAVDDMQSHTITPTAMAAVGLVS